MNIDTGLAIVILAVLIFYLRLIVLQRQRAKQANTKQSAGRERKARASQQPRRNATPLSARTGVTG